MGGGERGIGHAKFPSVKDLPAEFRGPMMHFLRSTVVWQKPNEFRVIIGGSNKARGCFVRYIKGSKTAWQGEDLSIVFVREE